MYELHCMRYKAWLRSRKFNTWIDNLDFAKILLIWAGIVTFFGLTYYFFSNGTSSLFSTQTQKPVMNILDHIYFSFITATSTGFGDIVPTGFFKIIAIAKVTLGLLLLAFVTSRLISIKQNIILNEIYEISFSERISRMRSSMLLFRQHINRIIAKAEDETLRQRDIDEISVDLSSLLNILREMTDILKKDGKKHFTKAITQIDAELLINSMTHSFSKVHDLVFTLNHHNVEWKKEVSVKLIRQCIKRNHLIFGILSEQKTVPYETLRDIETRNRRLIKNISEGLE